MRKEAVPFAAKGLTLQKDARMDFEVIRRGQLGMPMGTAVEFERKRQIKARVP